jgi:hypothetical protein
MISKQLGASYRSDFQRERAESSCARLTSRILCLAMILFALAGASQLCGQTPISIVATSLNSPIASLPPCVAGDAYPVIVFKATGGTAPYGWTATGLPPNMTVNSSTGTLGGTPSSAGVFSVTITVKDSAIPPQTVSQTYSITISANAVLTIVAPTPMQNGVVASPYYLGLTAVGGTAPYTWSLFSGTLPAGLTFTSDGVLKGTPTHAGNYSFTVEVKDSASAAAVLPLAMTVTSNSPTLSRVGVLSQIAAGGGWMSSLYLINNSHSALPVTINFYGNDGAPLNLPATLVQGGNSQTQTASTASVTINPYSTLLIESDGQSSTEMTGWADVLSSAPLAGYAVFHYTSQAGVESEGTVTLETSPQTTLQLPYDNTNGLTTAVAITNLAPVFASNITATIWDANGTPLGVRAINLPAFGHFAFALTDYLPEAATNRGIVVFTNTTGGNVTGLALRVNPKGGLTSLPVLVAQ